MKYQGDKRGRSSFTGEGRNAGVSDVGEGRGTDSFLRTLFWGGNGHDWEVRVPGRRRRRSTVLGAAKFRCGRKNAPAVRPGLRWAGGKVNATRKIQGPSSDPLFYLFYYAELSQKFSMMSPEFPPEFPTNTGLNNKNNHLHCRMGFSRRIAIGNN